MFKNCKRIVKILHRFLFIVIASGYGIAVAQVKFTTIINDKQPEISGYVQVEYTVENAKSIKGIAPPSFRNFRIIQGPVQSNGLSYMNGVLSHSKSVSLIIQPLVTGKQLVPGATAFIDGRMMRSEPVLIDVREPGSKGNVTAPGMPPVFPEEEKRVDEEYVLRPGESVVDKIKDNLLVKADINKTTCYIGEPIIATFTLSSRLNSESRVLKRPSLNGFSVYDMIEPEANSPSVQSIGGKYYNVHIIRKTQLFPLQPGTFIIDPVELDNKVRFLKKGVDETGKRSRIQELLDEFVREEPRSEVEHNFTLASKPVTITVKPLPVTNVPAGFNGAVGKFTLKADSKTEPVAAGDAITLQVEIRGEGNFTVINPPVLSLPPGMESYEPVVKENVDKTIYPLSGTKTFDYTFIIKDTGVYNIPAVAFSYFDPTEELYKTARTDSFNIRVIPALTKKDPENKVAYAEPLKPSDESDSIPFAAVILLLAIFFFAGVGIQHERRKRRKKRRRQSVAPSVPANTEPQKVILEPLKEARRALEEGRSQQFYSAISKDIWTTLSEKLNIASTDMNKSNAVLQLKSKGADNAMIDETNTILQECEVALYTPGHTEANMQQTLVKAEKVISYLQTSVT